ncbi:MAG TPA: GNAT family N-acetyltransferase [Dissulfurispiraceae bacterium]|nr:GNAT family N-acetyltransferase [Dissulfurispiraceae bacterium]
MRLDAMTRENAELVRRWRNIDIDMYRTPFMLTEEMQSDFYDDVICDRYAKHRFWAVMLADVFIGMVGLVNISLENRSAEVSVVIDPELRKQGHGRKAVDLLLGEGFYRINLDNIYGECYKCSPARGFWESACMERGVKIYELPRRKYVSGIYWDSIYFNFTRTNTEGL